MKEGGFWSESTLTGLDFERKVDFQNLIQSIPEYELKEIPNKAGKGLYFKKKLVGRCFRKHDFYLFLTEEGIEWKNLISKKYYLTMLC